MFYLDIVVIVDKMKQTNKQTKAKYILLSFPTKKDE